MNIRKLKTVVKDEICVDFLDEIIEELLNRKIRTPEELERRKVELCRKYHLDKIPSNSTILKRLPPDATEAAELLRLKPSRTVSGIAALAIMSSPYNCPHGTCIYCPGGVLNNSAQAYTGKEPAARRAAMNNFDPYAQARARIEQLNAIGHSTSKLELIIMGGTFTARTEEYQEWFIRRAFDAMNNSYSRTIEEAHAINENAANRCVGLTIETRPDQLSERQLDFILRLGATRVEIGVQCIFDEVLKRINRGHDVQSVIDATRRAKERGLKICYHMMPGLPGMTREMELQNFRQLFEREEFRPDMLKIYPTLVIEGTPLYEMHRKGLFREMSTEEAVQLLAEVKRDIPEYVRIQRIQRDIPADMINAGVKKSNLRELIREEMERRGWRCRCIRCREIGHVSSSVSSQAELIERRYSASGGEEVFLSFEADDAIIGYLRLRLSQQDTAYVRELKVFGTVVPVGASPSKEWQHRGFGARLMREAEEIAFSAGYRRMRVISAVGTRDYYRKLGYDRDGTYMARSLNRVVTPPENQLEGLLNDIRA